MTYQPKPGFLRSKGYNCHTLAESRRNCGLFLAGITEIIASCVHYHKSIFLLPLPGSPTDLRVNQIESRKAFENPIPTRPFCLYIRALVVNVSISPAKARSQVGQSRMDHLPHNRIKGNRFRHLVPRPSVGTQVADSVLPIVLAVLMSILLLEPMLSGMGLTAPKPTLELSKHGQTSTSQLRGILLRPLTSVVTIELRHQTQSSLPCVERLCAYLS